MKKTDLNKALHSAVLGIKGIIEGQVFGDEE